MGVIASAPWSLLRIAAALVVLVLGVAFGWIVPVLNIEWLFLPFGRMPNEDAAWYRLTIWTVRGVVAVVVMFDIGYVLIGTK